MGKHCQKSSSWTKTAVNKVITINGNLHLQILHLRCKVTLQWLLLITYNFGNKYDMKTYDMGCSNCCLQCGQGKVFHIVHTDMVDSIFKWRTSNYHENKKNELRKVGDIQGLNLVYYFFNHICLFHFNELNKNNKNEYSFGLLWKKYTWILEGNNCKSMVFYLSESFHVDSNYPYFRLNSLSQYCQWNQAKLTLNRYFCQWFFSKYCINVRFPDKITNFYCSWRKKKLFECNVELSITILT